METAVETKKAKKQEEQGVEAKTVELGKSREELVVSMGLGEYVREFMRPKYPDKYITLVWKEDVRLAFKGWHALILDTAKGELKLAKDFDEATKTAGNILAWRDMKVHLAAKAEDEKRRKWSNDFSRSESSSSQAKLVSDQVKELSGGKITARALTADEEN